jgi:quinoprotein glucose dehydrogenase
MRRTFWIVSSFLCVAVASLLADTPSEKPYSPKVVAASDEGQKAIKRFRVPKDLQVELFAAEPLLANPVAIWLDEKGRCYVAETFRLGHGVTDNRNHMYWLDDDLASRTVEDRIALYKKHLKDKFPTYETDHDRIRLIEDTDGDGVADKETVFADGFHSAASGIGAGVLARKGNVYYACIPDLWLLRDTKGTGKADERKALHTGYGVHVAFIGHDLHGLRFGPDGKLYFSIGDRGLNVKTQEGKTIPLPDTGAVLRCDPDGSNLEVVATGLRNPQKLAFDARGNLFTCDNNSDSGDAARWVYIVEGGDSGWRTSYQYGTVMSDRGPFNAEKIWHLPHEGQPAYIVPPLAHLADGPSGLCAYPGTGLPERYKDHFFLCDFRGDAGRSGVWSFAVKPKGAAFELVDKQEFLWSVLATDCEFGPDSALYVSDWVEGWGLTGKGRIYRVADPELRKSDAVKEVKKLLADGFDKRPREELAELLGHADMRVRQEAQFALADKGKEAISTFTEAAKGSKNQLARLHAVWGLGQIGRKEADAFKHVSSLLADGDAEVRAQAAKVLGDGRVAAASEKLIALLKDSEPRVRFFAAQALGRIGVKEAVGPVLVMLRDNADKDAYLRHAGVMALAGSGDTKALLAAAEDTSPAVRMAVLLALRRVESKEVARFLADTDPLLVQEAARAIHDVPINEAMPQLAAFIRKPGLPVPMLYRVLNANFRLGKEENAVAVAAFAARADAPEALRVEALRELGAWAKPSGRDRVLGLWRPLEPRSLQLATDALRPVLGGIFAGPDKVRQEAAKVTAALGVKEVGPVLLEMAGDTKRLPQARVEALRALEALKDERLDKAMRAALTDAEAKVRTEGRRLLAKVQPAEALDVLAKVLDDGSVAERQGAFAILGQMKEPVADELLTKSLSKLLARELPPEVHLDLLEAAAKHPAEGIKAKLAKFEAARAKDDHLARYREALVGGDAEAGRNIFLYKAEVYCLRCHKVNGEGGEVGPDLTGIGKRQNRDYLLESIVDPNRQIAKGFETVVVTLKSGISHTGIVKAEDAKELRLMTAEGKLVVIPKDKIDERQTGKSAMPDDVIKHLSKSELRDLVEFLAGLK